MRRLDRLQQALAVSAHGRPATLAAAMRKNLDDALAGVESAIEGGAREALQDQAARLDAAGIDGVVLGSENYPKRLSALRFAPPVLYFHGAPDLLSAPGIGMCGSRKATDEGLRAAGACGSAASERGLTVVSGYAKGVDMATHVSALRSGGRTTIVLAEGIERFRVRRGEFAEVWDQSRSLVVSQFAPTMPWSAGNAMTRNGVIVGLAEALVVVEAGATGGTLAAGLQALDAGRPVFALAFDGAPPGNAELIRKGALPIRSRVELTQRVNDLMNGRGEQQMSLLW